MSRTNQLISLSTALLVAFLAAGAFWLSFDALRHLAAANGVAQSKAWLYPAIIDGAIIIFSLSVLQASLNRRRTRYPWALVGAFTLLSVLLNIVHAPTGLLPRLLAAIPPLALFLSFELLMGQVKGMVQRAAALESLQELAEAVRKKRAELEALITEKQAELNILIQEKQSEIENLSQQTDQLAAKKGELLAELQSLKSEIRIQKVSSLPKSDSQSGTLDRANRIRLSKKEEAMADLLNYLLDNPDASLSDMADAINRSRSTAGSYVSELQSAGRLYKNGHGWEVQDAV